MIPTSDDVFRPGGLISRRLKGYESRPQQLEMASAVAAAIESKSHLVVEAGTGVGKSFGYLVPCLLAAAQANENRKGDDKKRRRIVVSTHTISLQEQLIAKDIPFLNSILPIEFSAVLVKGRGNYLSKRRLQVAGERGATLFESEEATQYKRIHAWEKDSYDGSLADLGFSPLPQVWDEVRSEHGNCLGRKCPTYDDCFYYRARRRVWNADLLVVNHALFFSDLALRRDGASVLPNYDAVVFDEAHTVEDVGASHLGGSVSQGQFNYLFNKLYNERGNKGLFVSHASIGGQKLVYHLRIVADELFDRIDQWREGTGNATSRVRKPLNIENNVSTEMHDLALHIRGIADTVKDEGRKIELTSAADSVNQLSASLSNWLKQANEGFVYWVETTGAARRRQIKLLSSPIDVGETLRNELFAQTPSVILTSATLAVGRKDFSYFRGRVGLTKANEVKLGSPFDYQKQASLVLPDRMPDPTTDAAAYERAVIERIRQHVQDRPGGAFVLFTSYRMLQNCSRQLGSWFSSRNRLLLCQGAGTQRSALLERFRADGEAVLFGTESFWQGVDVPGDALQNVIITKLPFSVPDHPLLEARMERIKEQGGNPFTTYQIPEAAIKLRQGFGRLIRTATDTGQVVILDPRIRTKPYGRVFLESLPECRRVIAPATGDQG